MKQQQQGLLLTNITDNNNFYVSEKILDRIVQRIQQYNTLVNTLLKTPNSNTDELVRLNFLIKKNQVSQEEYELIKRVLERQKQCYVENIHYWVMNNNNNNTQQQQSQDYKVPTCHWCSKKITEYR